jgi:AraC-like DNA-binding protein
MRAHISAFTPPEEPGPAPVVIQSDVSPELDGRVGLIVEWTDGEARLWQGALAGLEPGDRASRRLILAMARTEAPDWLAGMSDRLPLAPSAFTDLIANMVETLAESSPGMAAGHRSTAVEAILLLVRTARDRPSEIAPSSDLADDPVMLAAARLIEERLLDPTLDAASLMQALHLSRSSLYRAFQGAGGVKAYIRQRRLEHARDVLARPSDPRPTVGEVAASHGFASDSHFSRAFRTAFGHSPGARRKDPASGGA